MSNFTPHTIRLQDGSLCNLTKRIAKQVPTLLSYLETISDPRKKQGRRHSATLILLLVFVGLLRGSKDLKDVHLFASLNQRFFRTQLGLALPHGIPDPTTISRLLGRLEPDDLVQIYLQFLGTLDVTRSDVMSYDGKTMCAASGEGTVRHILSFFSHGQHLALGQVGVDGKGREIPAFEQLLKQGETSGLVSGKLLLGDALHTQKATVKATLRAGADYLFVVKGNQRQLGREIATELAAADKKQLNYFVYKDTKRKREVTTTVTVLRAVVSATGQPQELLPRLTRANHWDGVATIGVLHRTGTRTGKDGTAHQIDETIGLLSSRTLTAEEVATHLRNHWCIENNLHWTKDVVFDEDKHTLRRGNAPQVMSWLRSMCISLFNALKLRSISDTIHNLEKSPKLLEQFLRMAAVM
jgi:predicted transposase YbfD/YdcC